MNNVLKFASLISLCLPIPVICTLAETEDAGACNEQINVTLTTPSSATNSSTKKGRKKSTRKTKVKDDNATTSTKKKRKSTTTTRAPIVVPISEVQVHKDDTLYQFQNICLAVANESSYLLKTDVLRKFFTRGTDGDSFKGDLKLWGRLLLPNTDKLTYSLQNIRLVNVFSRIFQTDAKEMFTDLEAGDVAATVSRFFERSLAVRPRNESTLSLQDTDACLQKLSTLTKEDDQTSFFAEVCKKCTVNDLQMFVRLIKHDLRINAGPKHILDAFHPDAYEAFKTNRDINSIIGQIDMKENQTDTRSLNVSAKPLSPIQPMLANPCKSLDETLKKYEDGLYAEIKYDGERVQLHKQGSDFKYLSRNMKPVQPHKVEHFASYIEKAFPFGEDIILDCEVLMMDRKTGDPLPFGTLSKYKKNKFEDANPCLIVFDCLYFNGQSLIDRTLEERYKLLRKNLVEIPHHIQISESELIMDVKDLETMLTTVLDKGLEGLILKNPKGLYEPGKRHWIKVKRDYLFEGKAADTLDLVVLGAWYGSGRRGGIMNMFLMGCYDQENDCWRSVTKVHGTDDETLQATQKTLESLVVKISRDSKQIPTWLNITNAMAPDFVARDPKLMPVWEVTGYEFTKNEDHEKHTAGGISLRFPRLVRVRDDKTWESATSLSELKNLVEVSKTNVGSRLKSFFSTQSEANTTSTTESVSETRTLNSSPAPEMNATTSDPEKLTSTTKVFRHC